MNLVKETIRKDWKAIIHSFYLHTNLIPQRSFLDAIANIWLSQLNFISLIGVTK
jgi:hypothetical protein